MTTTLGSLFERLKELSFPEFAESDDLADWQADLSELDGHVAGIATTILAGGTADLTTIRTHVDELRQRLEAIQKIPKEDHEIVVECKHYLVVLEEVVQSMNT